MDNNINNLNNSYIKINTNPSKQAEIVKENTQNSNQNQNLNNSNYRPDIQNNTQNLFLYNTQNTKMANEMVLRYLQSLLEMPETIEKFIEQMSNSKAKFSDALDTKTQIIIQEMLDTAQLAKFLKENSKTALQKILNIISNSLNSGIKDTSQLREILSVLTNIQQNLSSASNYNSIKEFLLLYIPLDLQAFDRAQNSGNLIDDEEENKQNSVFSILFETLNFSSFSVALQEIDSVIYISLSLDKSFPFDRFRKIIQDLSSKMNIRTAIELKTKKQNETVSMPKIQNFKIVSCGKVPINIILCAHLLIETVFKIDKDFLELT